jgi:hypothetical protein
MPSAGWNDDDESKRKSRQWNNKSRSRWAWEEREMVNPGGGSSGTRYIPVSVNSDVRTPEDTSADEDAENYDRAGGRRWEGEKINHSYH